MIDLVDMIRHADEMMIDDLIFAVANRFAELYPDRDLLMISVDKNRDYLQQIYDSNCSIKTCKTNNRWRTFGNRN